MHFTPIKQIDINGSYKCDRTKKRYSFIGNSPNFDKNPIVYAPNAKKVDYLLVYAEEAYYCPCLNALLRTGLSLEDLDISISHGDDLISLDIKSSYGSYFTTPIKVTEISNHILLLV